MKESRYFAPPSTAKLGAREYGWLGIPGSKSHEKKHHVGLDYIGVLDSPVTAVASGRVVMVVNAGPLDRGLGNTVVIQHAMASPTFSLYGHLNSVAPLATTGRYVVKGQRIGAMGKSGAGSNGIVHLHFELKQVNSLSNFMNSVGYTKEKSHPDTAGYFDPGNYFGIKKYDDLSLASANPSLAYVGAGLTSKPMISNPFSKPSVIDLRLQALTSSGDPIKELAAEYNNTVSGDRMGFKLATASHGLGAGTYQLELQYKAAGSTRWFVLPFGTAPNPWPWTVTRAPN